MSGIRVLDLVGPVALECTRELLQKTNLVPMYARILPDSEQLDALRTRGRAIDVAKLNLKFRIPLRPNGMLIRRSRLPALTGATGLGSLGRRRHPPFPVYVDRAVYRCAPGRHRVRGRGTNAITLLCYTVQVEAERPVLILQRAVAPIQCTAEFNRATEDKCCDAILLRGRCTSI